MTRAERVRCWAYGAIALASLIGTQWALVAAVRAGDGLGDVVDGPVAVFLTVDLLGVAVAATIFMVGEGRRIALPRLWFYVALVFVVAVSVAFPLFLLARTRHLAAQTAPLGSRP